MAKISYTDLVRSAEEYHLHVFGTPLNLAGEPTTTIQQTINAIEQYISAMQLSFSGREILRTRGWQIEEHEPLLIQIAEELAGAREFDTEGNTFSTIIKLN